jgi:ATPase subunit of ABC transporter with duplicated ATPase domains
MSALITLDAVSGATPDGRVLFENLSLSLGRERTALVGRNGVGKTTLARLILGEIEPVRGSVSANGRVAALRQTFAPAAGATVADVLSIADDLALLARIVTGAAREGDLERADWDLPARAESALERCGLAGVAFERPAAALSGGQMTRLALAALLIAEPDFIVLDEPTNNLDADGRDAVREMLASWRGGALVISHDRELLRGMDRIVELSTLGARVYGGNYDLYIERREAERETAERTLDSAEREVERVDRAVQLARERKERRDAAGKRSRAKNDMPKLLLNARAEQAENSGARGTRLADRLKSEMSDALEAAQQEVERVRSLAFALPPSELAAGKTVLAFEDVSFAWPEQARLIDGLSFQMRGPERVALRGGNGSGKSTLIGLARGTLAPHAGRIVRGVEMAVLDQRASMLRDEETLLANFLRLNPEANENAAYEALAKFLFRNVAALKLAGELSGGERLRAAVACTLFAARPPQLLILDEPTNHLDLHSIEAIESALSAYDGALLVASHDEDFLEAIGAGRMIEPSAWS